MSATSAIRQLNTSCDLTIQTQAFTQPGQAPNVPDPNLTPAGAGATGRVLWRQLPRSRLIKVGAMLARSQDVQKYS
jgi:hypothetical protein